ncbi:molybdopterin cofactor-binding domain-containing protein [Roseivirga sp. E12]|uniref:molybdopterin cofactor-binding domain-containing protein n=1 Tax=Roseivirga sp. E12 TaxID=2819237 RepID=UPI001ABC60CA|nr:molybdopterin cofactor-binding domain-containing protein [Roseivirga sp. E12]MBO3698023.1 molybdopterin-dependent oxidoreductase [Roseivirga sp. E12]
MKANKLNRRRFLQVSGMAGAMLAVGFDSLAFGSDKSTLKMIMPEDLINGIQINPYVTISESGEVTIMAHVPELGQGIFQGIPAIIAEELGVTMEQVTIVKASASRKYGRQSIGGSRSVRSMFMPMRQLGAATREVLVQAAAKQWGVDASNCEVKEGVVYKKGSKDALPYGDLVASAAKLELPKKPTLKNKADFNIIGKATHRPDLVGKVNGSADYGIDAQTEGLLYATIERCPTLQGTVTSYDADAAKSVKGVIEVMEVTRTVYGKKNTGIAVVAETYYAATEGRKKLSAEWDNAEFSQISTESINTDMAQLAQEKGLEHFEKGDFEASKGQRGASSDIKVKTSHYRLPHVAHSCMEPMNATVHVREDNTVEVWAPSQSPQVQRQFARQLGIPDNQAEEKIKVHLPFLGGGFGRRSMNDSLEECFQISKALRKPVKLIWSREDDTTQGPFRQTSFHRMTMSFNSDNRIGLQHKVVSPAITTQSRPSNGRVPFEVMEAINTHYDFDDISVRYSEYKNQIPIHWWRSVFGSTNAFPHESFIDEMAFELKVDPLQFRKTKLKSEPRFIKVLEKLEEQSNWNEKLGENEGKGVAIVESFGSIVAHAVFLKRENGKVSMPKVVSVVDCGIYVNPDQVIAQTEGNIIYGLTAALKDAITFKNGAAQEANFDTYRMLRMNEAPRDIQVHLMENNEAPGGVGEPGLPPIAPALANAVFDLSGKRMRILPFDLQKI